MLVEIRDEDVYKVIPAYCGFNNTEEEKRIPITMISDADPTIRESYSTVRNFIFNTFTGYEIDTPHSLVIEYKKRDTQDTITTSSSKKDEVTGKDFNFTLDILDEDYNTIKGTVTLDEYDNVIFFKKFDENAPRFRKDKKRQSGEILYQQNNPYNMLPGSTAWPSYMRGPDVINTSMMGRNDAVVDTSTGSSVSGSELKINNPGVNVEGSGTIVGGSSFKIAKPDNNSKK